jgi:hypothetical protein
VKVKTALKKSQVAVRLLMVALPLVLVALYYVRRWQLGAIAGVMLLYLVMNLLNISRIKRRLASDPAYADREKTEW